MTRLTLLPSPKLADGSWRNLDYNVPCADGEGPRPPGCDGAGSRPPNHAVAEAERHRQVREGPSWRVLRRHGPLSGRVEGADDSGCCPTGSHSTDRRECAHAPLPARSASSGPATAGADRQAAGAGPGAAWSSDGGATASAVAFTPGSSAAIAISAADDVPRATVGFAASSATSSATAAAASARSATSRRTVWRASATAQPPRGGVAAAEPSPGLRRCEGPDRPAQAPIGPDCQNQEAARASPRRGAHADSIAARRRPQGAARWHGDGTHWRTAVSEAAFDVQAVFRRAWIHGPIDW